MKAIILAGGKGTRLAPYTTILPKPLMPIGEMPVLEILIRQIKASGIHEVVLSVGHLAQLLEAFFQGGKKLGVNISYSLEEHPLGTAGPISLVDSLDNTFLVCNGDVLTTIDFCELIAFHESNHAIATIATHKRSIKIDLGVIEPDPENEIVGYIEKPTYHFCVSMGIYVFSPRVLEYIPSNEYLDIPNLMLNLIAAGERVMSFPFEGYYMDLGRVSDYEQALRDFESLRPLLFAEHTNGRKQQVDFTVLETLEER